jgi:photoactive yellow protein
MEFNVFSYAQLNSPIVNLHHVAKREPEACNSKNASQRPMPTDSNLTGSRVRALDQAGSFSSPELFDSLDRADDVAFNKLGFGAIALRRDGVVERYNDVEARWSGLRPASVIGKNFFTQVAPCTNNEIIAARFLIEGHLDLVLEYVFTYRLIPTKVRLRLLKRPSSPLMYLLVEFDGD